MTFWEKHRSAVTTAGLGFFLLLVTYFGWVRGAKADARDLEGSIGENRKRLAAYYPEIKSRKGAFQPLLADVRKSCERRRAEYEGQLKDLTKRLRFPFTKDSVPRGERPGLYVIQRADVVAETVDKYRAMHRGGSHTQLVEGWLEFKPRVHPHLVKEAEAIDSLRKLNLAERLTKLAIDQDVSWVLKVKPQNVSREAAYYYKWEGSGKRRKRVRKAYSNAFIINYPVGMTMIGSIDSIMKFFHSVRGKNQFLVIRSFKMSGVADVSFPKEIRETVDDGHLYVTISAACMDFAEEKKTSKPKTAAQAPPDYEAPTGPRGY